MITIENNTNRIDTNYIVIEVGKFLTEFNASGKQEPKNTHRFKFGEDEILIFVNTNPEKGDIHFDAR